MAAATRQRPERLEIVGWSAGTEVAIGDRDMVMVMHDVLVRACSALAAERARSIALLERRGLEQARSTARIGVKGGPLAQEWALGFAWGLAGRGGRAW
jgi:hypothetical protein